MTTPTTLPINPYSNRGREEYLFIKAVGSVSATPGAITTATTATGTITVPGAALGDIVLASYGATLSGCSLSAYVSDGNTVTWVISNNTGTTQTPAAATPLTVVVLYQSQGVSPF